MALSERSQPPELSLFDCDIGFGESGMAHGRVDDPAAMCAMLDRYGIDEALVYDVQMAEGARVRPGDAERLLIFCSHHRDTACPGTSRGRARENTENDQYSGTNATATTARKRHVSDCAHHGDTEKKGSGGTKKNLESAIQNPKWLSLAPHRSDCSSRHGRADAAEGRNLTALLSLALSAQSKYYMWLAYTRGQSV